MESDIRIEIICAKRFPEFSRTKWSRDGVFINEKEEKPGKTKGKVGEEWLIRCNKVLSNTALQILVPWDYSLKILKTSKSWVAIEKPVGVSVHNSTSEKTDKTIVNALIHEFGKGLSDDNERPGIVHRLDKTTSGVLLVAKTNLTHRYFQDHWKTVEKTYYAIVEGAPPKKGKIEAGILRDFRDRKRMTVSNAENAKDSITYFETIETNDSIRQYERLSLLKITIPTGRTHQIRVHLSSIGFPVLGDLKYGGSKANRIYLHAERLRFSDPDKSDNYTVIGSPLPDKFLSRFHVDGFVGS